MTELERKLGYTFRDKALLTTALTHSSYANESKLNKQACNERLEFLGDSILGFTVAKYLYREHAHMTEGSMTKRRAELVCEQSLVRVADKLDLGEHLHLGRGEALGGGRNRPSILADAVEALFAAVFLDGGTEKVEEIILCLLDEDDEQDRPAGVRDYKTALQELIQRRPEQSLSYHLLAATGPDHQKVFSVEVQLNAQTLGQGSGRSKKEAEQEAAAAALKNLTAE